MRNLKLIISREYLARVRNKTFIVMTFLSPLIFVGMIMLIAYLSMLNSTDQKIIGIHDDTGIFAEEFKDDYPEHRYIDYYTPANWPTVFEIVREGYLCQTGLSIVMASTLHYFNFIKSDSIKFEMISNHVTGTEGAIFRVEDYFFNFIPGEIASKKYVRDNSVTFHSSIITLDKLYA